MFDANLSSLGDWELLRRSRRNPEAFGVFYDRHVDAVLRYCARRTASDATAADITQEVFAAAYVKRTTATSKGAPALAWLYGIARRQIGSFHRKEEVASRFRRKLGLEIQVSDGDDEVARVDALVDLEQIRGPLIAALADLPESHAEAVRMRVLDHRSYREVAMALGCSEGAARVRVSRALTRLADELETKRTYTGDGDPHV